MPPDPLVQLGSHLAEHILAAILLVAWVAACIAIRQIIRDGWRKGK